VSSVKPKWLDDVVASYAKDPVAQEMIAALMIDSVVYPNYTWHKGVLRYKSRIWIGVDKELQSRLLQDCHASGLGGHSGAPVTYRRIKQLFSWKGMKKDVHDMVQSCITCQMAKPDRTKSSGLLQPLLVPEGSWQIISLDFIKGLPLSSGANCILVVVDKFTKYAHFVALKHPYTTASVAKIFIDQIYRLQSMPSSIISVRDRIFTSNLWQELFRLAKVQLRMSSAYHPQSDGQTECVNQCLDTFLRCFVSACPHKWHSWLALTEFWYNSNYHSTIVCSPFQALYGYAPRCFGVDSFETSAVGDLHQWLQDRQLMTDLVKQHLNRAVVRMKHQADKGRTKHSIVVGDLVFLRLQPYIQSSVAPRASQTLAFKFFGPFPVVQKVGFVAYWLELPAQSTVHPMFHVSLLKKVVERTCKLHQNCLILCLNFSF
jgi:hypothetical protein